MWKMWKMTQIFGKWLRENGLTKWLKNLINLNMWEMIYMWEMA